MLGDAIHFHSQTWENYALELAALLFNVPQC